MKTFDRLWKSLVNARISTLSDLVHEAAKHDRLASGESILISTRNYEPAPDHDRLPVVPPIVHRPPGIPLVLDGKLLKNPEEITSYNGTPLYYTPLSSHSGLALGAFTSRDKMIAEAKHLAASLAENILQPQFEPIGVTNPDHLPEQVCFFEHINEEGDVLCLPPRSACPDLTRVGRSKLLWWYTNDWNDVISSVSLCRWDVTLFEHINFGGSQLWLPAVAAHNYRSLVELGWNDRTSSIVNWGQRI